MEVYRITLARYADELFAPGFAGRWNRKGQFVIYTAASRSLACLENLVHRRGIALQAEDLIASYKVMVIHVPDTLAISRVEIEDLSAEWALDSDRQESQQIGSAWYSEAKTAILSVPSAVVPAERNLVLHTRHPDFAKIQLIHTESFVFDPRLIKGSQ
jgi:RES domain-containing protein